MTTNYPTIYFQHILQYFLSNLSYLGTGDNQELVFTLPKSYQYIIIFIADNFVYIQGDFEILNQLRQHLLQLNIHNP